MTQIDVNANSEIIMKPRPKVWTSDFIVDDCATKFASEEPGSLLQTRRNVTFVFEIFNTRPSQITFWSMYVKAAGDCGQVERAMDNTYIYENHTISPVL